MTVGVPEPDAAGPGPAIFDAMTDSTAVRTLLTDGFSRIRELVESVTGDLDAAAVTYRPDPAANTVGWLIWHLSRVQDSHVADVAGVAQAWTAAGWQQKFGLPFDPSATGYGQSAEDVAAVDVAPALLAGYHADVDRLTTEFLATVDAAALARVVDENWDPPVNLSARLVSVLSDCLQHLGQAAYVRGLAERAG